MTTDVGDELVDDEAGAVQDVAQAILAPHREPAAGEVVVGEHLVALRVAGEHGRLDRRARHEGAVEVVERHRDLVLAEVHVGVAGPAGRERRAAEGEGPEVGLHAQARRRHLGARRTIAPGGIERHDRLTQRGGVPAGPAPEVDRHARRPPGAERLGLRQEPRPSLRLVAALSRS